MRALLLLLHTFSRRPILLSALKVALVVGTLLNLVNQGGRVLDEQPLILWQMLLNFTVPFCVSGYSAARNEIRRCESDTCRDE